MRAPVVRFGTVLAVAGAALFAWWATSLRPFTGPALLVTLAAGLAVLAAGDLLRRRGRRSFAWAGPVRGLMPWAVLAAALAGWELAAFLQLPRHEHPTLSSLANAVFDSHAVRAGAFLAWLAAGLELARR